MLVMRFKTNNSFMKALIRSSLAFEIAKGAPNFVRALIQLRCAKARSKQYSQSDPNGADVFKGMNIREEQSGGNPLKQRK
jgi:hypothetical protein